MTSLENQSNVLEIYLDLPLPGKINMLKSCFPMICFLAVSLGVTILVSLDAIHPFFILVPFLGAFSLPVIFQQRVVKTLSDQGSCVKTYSFKPACFVDHGPHGGRHFWGENFKFKVLSEKLELSFGEKKVYVDRNILPDNGRSVIEYLGNLPHHRSDQEDALAEEILLYKTYKYICDIAGGFSLLLYMCILFVMNLAIADIFNVWGNHLDEFPAEGFLVFSVGILICLFIVITKYNELSRPKPLLYTLNAIGILDHKKNRTYNWQNIDLITYGQSGINIHFNDNSSNIVLGKKFLPYVLEDAKRFISNHVSPSVINDCKN